MVNGYNATNINNVEMMSAFLSDPSTFSSVLGRIKKSEIKLATIPIPLTKRGKSNAEVLNGSSRATKDAAPITIAAHVDSATEPNKSAPMPAISPTLSPTLSAITAGFLGSSSGIPASTFPTRSAPTSAAFV